MSFKKFLSASKETEILANLSDGVIVLDKELNVDWFNEQALKIFGIERSEMTKAALEDILENAQDFEETVLSSSKPVVVKTKATGSFIEITSNKSGENLILCLRSVTPNYKTVTSLLVEHESFKKINKDKNNFLMKLSNELKSPLHSILGFSQAMVDGLGGQMSDKQEKYIKIIHKNSNELLYFLDKILELSRTESVLFDADFQIFDSVNSIQAVIKNNEAVIAEKNLQFSFDYTDVVKRAIYSEESLVRTIVQNLLEVAIKSTDIGSISIKALHPDLEFVTEKGLNVPEEATDKAYLMLTVSDTGSGINEADLAMVFDPYVQLEKTNKKQILRSIALASVKNAVRFLKGAIWVESEPMQGTTFSVIIPIEKFMQGSNE